MKRLTRNEMKLMCSTMEMKHFKKGTEIELGQKKIASDVFFLKRGVVKIVHYTNEGEEVIKHLIKKGDVFGIMGLIDIENNDDYAVALDDSLVCVISSSYFKKMMEENPKLNNHILKLVIFQVINFTSNL